MKTESEIACDVQADTSPGHRDLLPKKRVTREMDTAIRRLIDKPITRGKVIELFDYRASFPAISLWRYGHRGAPQWAVELIRSKLAKRAAEDLAIGAAIRPGVGMNWNKGAKTLAVWRERKARERDEKEKASG